MASRTRSGMPAGNLEKDKTCSQHGRLVLLARVSRSVLVATVVDKCGQVTKGARWMSWHREAKKDVVACDKPGEAGKQALIPGFLNRETGLVKNQSPATEFIGGKERTQGTETSKYLQEKKETSIP